MDLREAASPGGNMKTVKVFGYQGSGGVRLGEVGVNPPLRHLEVCDAKASGGHVFFSKDESLDIQSSPSVRCEAPPATPNHTPKSGSGGSIWV